MFEIRVSLQLFHQYLAVLGCITLVLAALLVWRTAQDRTAELRRRKASLKSTLLEQNIMAATHGQPQRYVMPLHKSRWDTMH